MERVSKYQIAMSFTGSFLGAGFVSGQEIYQFFGVFGKNGLVGMSLALIYFFISGCLLMIVAKRENLSQFDRIIVRKDYPKLRGLFMSLISLFLFGVVVIMIAGAGALINQMLGLPKYLGNILMTLALFIVSIYGVKGVLNTFSLVVPLMVITALIVGALSLVNINLNRSLYLNPINKNPLLANWFISTMSFVPYNMLAAFPILIPLSTKVEDEKTIFQGIFIGTILLLIVFIFILLPLIVYRDLISQVELPMIKIAGQVSPILEIFYSILLIGGMFSTSLSCLFGVTNRIKDNLNLDPKRLSLYLLIIGLISSMVGFKKIIGVFLPIFGYIGFFAIVGIVLHFFYLEKNKNI